MADEVDISGMPPPPAVGTSAEAQADPSTGMPAPEDLYTKHYGSAPASKELLDEFMANPPPEPTGTPGQNFRKGLSALTGLPRVAADYNPVTPVVAAVAGGAGALSGALGAASEFAVGDPATASSRASEDLEKGRQRLRDWSSGVYKLAEYLPSKLATKAGNESADALLSIPSVAGKSINDDIVRPLAGDNAADLVGDIGQDVGVELPGLGAKGLALKGVAGAKSAARAGKSFVANERASITPPEPPAPLKPDVAPSVSAESLRASPNPIPPPEGTVVSDRQKAAQPPQQPATPAADAPTREFADNAAAQPAAPAGPTLPETDTAPQDMSLSPEQRAIVREGVAARRAAADAQRGSVRLFNPPKDEGPQETPTPDQQSSRVAALNDLDKLSGGALPSRRASAISGDYNATGNDWQSAKTGNEAAQRQLASESDALHAATDNVHNSLGSLSDDSVDTTTLGDRGRTTRGAIQAIEKHFDDATDGLYETAREQNKGKQIPKPSRVSAYLDDDSNFTNDAEIGLQKATKARMERLWSSGDPDSGTPPGSVNGAERLREFLNEKGKNPSAMGVAKAMKDHLDMDVAEQGGPGLFESARAMRRHSYQMLEEPVGVKKLLTPGDSQGINHAIPEHKVMDYINDLPREQHEHLMDVLRAGAHMSPELAESSAAAIKEIQAHTISRLHDAATNDGGKWNARDFANAGARYARNAQSTFRDRPDVLKNIKTINDAGNTLHMDKSYPGAVGQAVRSGVMGAAVKGAGGIASSLAHEIPVVGRIIGRGIEGATEAATGDIGKKAAEKAFEKRTVDRNGKQRGSVQLFNDNELNRKNEQRTTFHGKDINPRNERSERTANQQMGGRKPLTDEQNDVIGRLMGGKQRGAVGDLSQRDAIKRDSDTRGELTHHRYSVPGDELGPGGQMHVTEYPDRDMRQVSTSRVVPSNRGQGWGTRMLQRAADDAHAAGQTLRSDAQVSDGAAGAYKNLKTLGYDVKMKPNDHTGGAYHAVGDHVFEVKPGKGYEAPDELKNFIKKSAPAHKVDESGPANWEDLKARRNEKVMPINPQGSEGSIYGDKANNIAFRAWHDKTHLDLNAGFDHDGELRTAQEQLRQAKAAGLSEESQKALWADTYETFKHHEENGEFPKDPRQFVAQRMRDTTPLGERMGGKQRGSVRVMKDVANKVRDKMEDVGERLHGFDQDVMDKATDVRDNVERFLGIRGDNSIGKRLKNKILDISENVGEKLNGADQDMMDKATELRDKAERSVGIRGKQRGSVQVMSDEEPEEGAGSQLNIGLHQGNEGDEGFRKMSKQEAQKAVESTGAKVTKSTVLTPNQHGVSEPTSVMSTDRPLKDSEMQQVLAKTKQSAIPQRTDAGEESMHVAPGHEQNAKSQGWDTFNPDYFREHSGQTATDAKANPKNIHPDSTVKDAKRSAYPGIYDDPMDVALRAETVPESPHLKEIFGTTRKQMHDAVIKQGDVAPKTPMPGMAAKGKGSAHAQQVTTPENAERVRNIISALKEAAPDAYHGMVAWYHMDPMYQSIKKILGGDADRAGDVFHKLNTYTALASPMSSVEPEIRRGTAAATAAAEGKFDQFKKYGGLPANKVPKSADALKSQEMGFKGHAFHGTVHAPAMSRFNETGQEANAPKTGAYRRASDAPSRPGSDYQNTVLVGDSHFSRGVGLADVRGAKTYDGSIDGTELKIIHPWYHENVAKPLGIPATSAQAAQWAAMSHDTGVQTAIGSPKLEIWADQIASAAKRAGVEPKVMWERIVKRLASK